MITVKLDPTGSQHVRWPGTAPEIITLAQRFLTRQNILPPEQRLQDVPLTTVQTLLTQMEAAVSAALTGEIGRATAAETLRQRLEQAKLLVARMVQCLKLEYATNLAQLEGWGLDTVQGTRGVIVRRPITQRRVIAFLRAYVAKETSLPVEQRITNPALATVQALLAEVDEALLDRTIGRDQREQGVEQRGDIQGELTHWLQTAALILVMQNGGKISTALQQHGFTVVERTSRPPNAPPNGLPAVPPAV